MLQVVDLKNNSSKNNNLSLDNSSLSKSMKYGHLQSKHTSDFQTSDFQIDDLYHLVRYARFDEQKLLSNFSQNNTANQDAIDLLTADHQYLTDLFVAYDNLSNASRDNAVEKAHLIAEICTELSIHTQIEEAIFYPAVKAALLNDGYFMDEPIIESAGLLALIADIEYDQSAGINCEGKIKILAEYLKYHVNQDRDSLFPKLRLAQSTAQIDLLALGQQIATKKSMLIAKHRALLDQKNTQSASQFQGMS